MSDAIRHYRLLPSALPAEEKLIRTRYMPTLFTVMGLSTVVLMVLGIRGGTPVRILWEMGAILVACLAYIAFWYPVRLKRRLSLCWETYDLEIGPNYFLRRQADLSDLRLSFDEIRSVERVPGRYVRVLGKRSGEVISIPEGIEQFEEVLAFVSDVHQVDVRRLQQWQKYRIFMAATFALFITMLWSSAPALVIPLSILMGALIIWTFLWSRRNPNLRRRSKVIGWLYLLFLLVCGMKLLVAIDDLLLGRTPN